MTKIEVQGRKGKDTGAWPGLQIRFQNKAPKGRKPLISLVKSRICGFHQKIGVTGFEPATSWSQTRRSSQAEPHPDVIRQRFQENSVATAVPYVLYPTPFQAVKENPFSFFESEGNSQLPLPCFFNGLLPPHNTWPGHPTVHGIFPLPGPAVPHGFRIVPLVPGA